MVRPKEEPRPLTTGPQKSLGSVPECPLVGVSLKSCCVAQV